VIVWSIKLIFHSSFERVMVTPLINSTRGRWRWHEKLLSMIHVNELFNFIKFDPMTIFLCYSFIIDLIWLWYRVRNSKKSLLQWSSPPNHISISYKKEAMKSLQYLILITLVLQHSKKLIHAIHAQFQSPIHMKYIWNTNIFGSQQYLILGAWHIYIHW
jgi:hypothetical protein